MKKMIKHYRGRASLKERTLKNSRAWRTPDEEGEWWWPKKSRVTRWGRRINSRAVHYLAEEDEDEQVSRGLNHLVTRSAAGTQWTWKKVTVVVDQGAAESVMPRSMFPEIGIRQTERSKNGKGFKGPGGENIKNYGQQVMSVRTLEGFVRKSTWQVADVRRPLVSASHIIQAGNDLFIGKDEAYSMNKKKMETSVLRMGKNVGHARNAGMKVRLLSARCTSLTRMPTPTHLCISCLFHLTSLELL